MERDWLIRRGRPDDAALLREIGVTGWETTYAGFITPENRQRYLAGPFWSIERLQAVLGDPGCACYVAEIDGCPAGFATVEPRGEGQVELTRLYVNPEARRRGIGRALVDAVLADARASGARQMLVNVFGDNVIGRRFYEREGFVLVEETITTVGDQTARDTWYALALSPSGRARSRHAPREEGARGA